VVFDVAQGVCEMKISINRDRLLENLRTQGRIGWEEGQGLKRAAYTQAYNEARDWLRGKMETAGLKTRVDRVGNLFGRLEGKNRSAILTGSHLDSVYNGGIYDGPLGIISALEAIAVIKENGIKTENSIEAVAFIAEEGEPLGGTFGSRAFAGLLPDGYKRDILKGLGLDDSDIRASKGDLQNYAAFVELHIEQGPYLERNGIEIGIPSGIVGISRHNITVRGSANHAGTTPMPERKDALRAAADIIHDWFKWMDGISDTVCNIGKISALPGHVSVVPEETSFPLEIRSIYDESIDRAVRAFERIAEAHREKPCLVTIDAADRKSPVLLDERLIDIIRGTADAMGLSNVVMPSGASHDTSPIARVIPAAMIFVPSRGGISHSKDEYTPDENVICGAEVLLGSLLNIDRVF